MRYNDVYRTESIHKRRSQSGERGATKPGVESKQLEEQERMGSRKHA